MLTDADIARFHHYAFVSSNGGWNEKLKRAFGRALGQDLSGKKPADIQDGGEGANASRPPSSARPNRRKGSPVASGC
jgi:hypothetical protein